jgi:arylsulfatase A-like enzyme
MLGDHRAFGKGLYFYEGITRTPLIVRAPGGTRGRVEDGLVSLVDLVPTALDLLGQPIPANVQGRSLLRGVTAGESCGQDAVFAAHHGRPGPERKLIGGRMIRTPTHKYCMYTTGEEELYDLAADPHEMRNLAGQASLRALQAELRSRLAAWMRETADFYPDVPGHLVS